MNKKLLALALIGVAAYLFRTQKGAEIRQKVKDRASQWSDKLGDMYHKARENGKVTA